MFKDIAASKDAFKILQDHEYIRYENLPLESRGGNPISVEFVSNVYLVDETKVIQCNIRDITRRKRTEEALRDANGRTLYYDGTVKDITKRKKAEERLLLSERTYRGIIDSITDAVYVEDENGVFIDVNRAAVRMYGYGKEQLIGQTQAFLSAQGKNDLSKFADWFERISFERECCRIARQNTLHTVTRIAKIILSKSSVEISFERLSTMQLRHEALHHSLFVRLICGQ